MFKYRTDLRERDAREPGDKVRDLGPIFEILEQGSNRNTSAAKNPGTTNALGVTLNGWARRPINHSMIVDPVQKRFNCGSQPRSFAPPHPAAYDARP